MTNSTIDFPKALALLTKLEGLTYQGAPVTDWLLCGRFNAWQAYRHRILSGDIKRFLNSPQNQAASTYRPQLSAVIKDYCGYLIAGVISLLALLYQRLRRNPLIIYSVDKDSSATAHNDQRLDFLYRFLTERSIGYLEFFHAFLGGDLIRNFLKRQRLAVYLLIFDFLYQFKSVPQIIVTATDLGGSFASLSEAEKDFALKVIAKYQAQIKKSQWQIKWLTCILKFSQVKAIWAIDNTRDYQELVIAAKLAEVPFYAFQHGHITKYHTGWLSKSDWPHELAVPDTLFVWSDYWKEELKRLGSAFPEAQVEIGGLKTPLPKVAEKVEVGSDKLGILIPFETEADPQIMKQYFELLLSDEAITIYFKLRPDVSAESQLTQMGLTANYHSRLIFTTKTEEIIDQVDVVAGTYSTFLYDMIAFYKPIVLLKTQSDFGEGLVVNGLAVMLDLSYLLPTQMKEVAKTPVSVLRERSLRLNGDGKMVMKQTLDQLASDLKII